MRLRNPPRRARGDDPQGRIEVLRLLFRHEGQHRGGAPSAMTVVDEWAADIEAKRRARLARTQEPTDERLASARVGRAIDMSGARIGSFAVMSRAAAVYHEAVWNVRCVDCGHKTTKPGSSLRNHKSRCPVCNDLTGRRFGRLVVVEPTLSCGCWRAEKAAARVRTHGLTDTPEHRAWRNARHRCTNRNSHRWARYGGRGIKFLFESFEQFFAEVGPRPSPKHSLDRPDNDGDYRPGNVRSATAKEQRLKQSTPALRRRRA